MNHIHKYYRVILKKRSKGNVPTGEDYVVYKCGLSGCGHYIARKLAVNRESICWECGEKFTLNLKALRLKKPRCPNCTNKNKEKANVNPTLDSVIGTLFK